MNVGVDVVRIGATVEPPFVMNCFEEYPEHCSKPGTDLLYLHEIFVNVFHIKIQWISFENFEQLESALLNNSIDIIGNTVVEMESDRSSDIEVYQTAPTAYLGPGFYVKTPPIIENTVNFSNFTTDLWFSIILTTTFLYLLRKFVKKLSKFSTTRIVVDSVYFTWFITLSLLLEFYGNLFTVDLILAAQGKPLFNNLLELSETLISKQCRLVLFERYLDEICFQPILNPNNATDYWADSFKMVFEVNPPLTIKDDEDLFTYVRNSSTCFIGLHFANARLSSCEGDIELLTFPDIPFRPYVYFHNLQNWVRSLDAVFVTDPFMRLPNILLRDILYNSPSHCQTSPVAFAYELTLNKLSSAFFFWIGSLCVAIVISCIRSIFYSIHFPFRLGKCRIKKRRNKYVLQ